MIVGTELIPGRDTDPGLVAFVEAFSRVRLGREIVRTHDTPAFAGNRVSMSALMRFHYDEHLSEYWNTANGQEDPWQVLFRREIAVLPAWLTRDRRDPFAILGLNASALPAPADAWDI